MIGIMQGRLLPPVAGRIQAFPGPVWRDEFAIASRIGFSSIEWILEEPIDSNPIWSEAGAAEIEQAILESDVRIDFICADYFMESPLYCTTPSIRERNQYVLRRAIDQASRLGAKGIEIPCVDASAIRSAREETSLVEVLSPCLKHAATQRIEVGLETSLPPARFRGLLEKLDHPWVKANYDTGNSAALGYNPAEELESYGRWVNNVHIKDRVRHGGTVPLGSGHADIPRALQTLKGLGYCGGYILQGARGGDDQATARNYKRQLESWLQDLRLA